MATWTSPAAHAVQNAAGTTSAGWWWGLRTLRDALVAAGMVQTADTGQVDFTLAEGSTTAPAAFAANTDSGFFIVKMNDALATRATNPRPFVLKIAFFAATGNNGLNGLRIQMGQATDGAGNITGDNKVATYTAWLGASSSTSGAWQHANQRHSYAAGNGSEMVVIFHDPVNANGEAHACFTIERTRDATGAYTEEGILLGLSYCTGETNMGAVYGPRSWQGQYNYDSTVNQAYGWHKGLIVPRTLGDRYTYVNGNDFGPLAPYGGGFFPNFRQTHVAYLFPNADMSTYGEIFTMPVFGVNRTFRNFGWAIPWHNIYSAHMGSRNTSAELQRYALAVMWE